MNDLSEFVTLHDSTLTTDTRRVAKHFKKAHKNVLRAFDNLDCSEEFNRLNFEPVEEVDSKGESRRVILITKDGFMFMVMGITGKESARIV
jgi:Rha family phage regulatory protein